VPLFNKKLSGVHVPHCKNTSGSASVRMPIPEKVILPMIQHMGAPCDVLVKVGDTVEVGQKIGDSAAFLSSPIFASVSGTVSSISDYVTAQGTVCKAVTITADGKQTIHETVKPQPVTSHKELVEAARNCGLVGLGGAGFPTNIKLNPKDLAAVDTVCINGAECEPFITCDLRTMLERTDDMLYGISLVKEYLGVKQVIIGIESNKPEAIKKLTELTKDMEGVRVHTLRSIYPQGGEKVLIYETTGRVVEEGKLPADAGVVVMNVATITKLADFVKTGMPLVEKMVTVDGGAIANPANVIVPVGALVEDIVNFCGGYKTKPAKLIMGGPMMGMAALDDQTPITKSGNAILAFDESQCVEEPETACIRCGRCARACPFDLPPASYDIAYHMGDVEKLRKLKVNLCMECGCCGYVCPAKRHLVTYNKLGKAMLRKASAK